MNRGKPAKPRPREKAILDARPDLDTQTLIVVTCLRHLESERQRTWRSVTIGERTVYGWHTGRVPYGAIADWGTRQGLRGASLDLLVDVIRIVDDEREQKQAEDFAARIGG